MKLKKNITAADFAALPQPLQGVYEKDGEGYVLDLDGGWDGFTRAKQHEVEAHGVTKGELAKLRTAHDTAVTERDNLLKGTVPKDNVTALENSYKTKQQELIDGHTKASQKLTAQINTLLVDNVANGIASKISTAPALLLPHVKARLKAEADAEGNFSTRVVDASGKPSALTVDDLQKEFLANKEFSAILVGSKATGGGAGSGGGSGGAGSGKGKIDFSKSPREVRAQMEAQGVAPDVTG